MSVNWVLFVLCSVCISSVLGDIIEALQNEIDDAKEKTNTVKDENKWTQDDINKKKSSFKEWVEKAKAAYKNLTDEETALIKEINDLVDMIDGNKTIKFILEFQIQRDNETLGKFKLAITIMNNVLDLLENFRNQSYSEECEYYEPWPYKLLLQSTENNNTIEKLKAELRKARLELHEATYRLEELVKEWDQTIENIDRTKDHYTKQFLEAFKNVMKAQSIVDDLKGQLEPLVKEVAELKKTLESIQAALREKEKDVEDLKPRYESYRKNIECYKRLRADVFQI